MKNKFLYQKLLSNFRFTLNFEQNNNFILKGKNYAASNIKRCGIYILFYIYDLYYLIFEDNQVQSLKGFKQIEWKLMIKISLYCMN